MKNTAEKRGIVLALVLIMSLAMSNSLIPRSHAAVDGQDAVDILLILDNGYGGNVPPILTILERYEWNVTTTALEESIDSCAYLSESMDADVLISEIENVTVFDAISIMPGVSHNLLRASQTALDLIRNAMAQNVVVSAWCKAVRVLATADVIDGRNITGSSEFESEYAAAGATFTPMIPPVIDGNLVTGVRSRFYRDEMCQAIAAAIGVYEDDVPSLDQIEITPEPGVEGGNLTLLVHLSDEVGVYMVTAKVYCLNDTGLKNTSTHLLHLGLDSTDDEGVYDATLSGLDVGNYTVDIFAWDNFLNEIEYEYAVNFSVESDQPDTSGSDDLAPLIIAGSVITTALVVVLAVLFIRRR